MSNPVLTIQQQVDTILFEEGVFSSIAWLLSAGHLDYVDYQNWRNSGTGYLEDHFKTALPEIIAGLKIAYRYAKRLKLDAVCQAYTSVAQQPLDVCRSKVDEAVFTTVYQPAPDRVQTDLFFDSAPVLATQDLITAIVDRRHDAVPNCLTRLKSLAPQKYPPFERLLKEQKQFARYPETESRIEYLQNTLTRSAFDVLGRFANDFLIPYWQQISLELSERRFDPAAPDDHLSFTAFRALQWQEVIVSIEREENWSHQPVLLYRYAEASFKLNREAAGLDSWFRLFLQFPEKAGRMVGETSNFLLLSDWRNFNELDPELEPAFFPAWTVLKKPALAKIAVGFDGENTAHCALQLIRDLAVSPDDCINEIVLNLRAGLRRLNPSLFVHYMEEHR